MNNQLESIALVHNDAEKQFEMHIGPAIAFIEYILEDNKIYLTHTEVPKDLNGRGVGSAIVKKTLQHIKDENLALIPTCPFIARYVDRHPEWHSLLSEGYKM